MARPKMIPPHLGIMDMTLKEQDELEKSIKTLGDKEKEAKKAREANGKR